MNLTKAEAAATGWADAWTVANIWESLAASIPDATALIQGEQVLTFAQFNGHADALARALLDAGLQHQSKVALYMPNRPEYLVAFHAASKAGLVPSNVNYRYGTAELEHIFEEGDAEAVVFDAAYLPLVETVRKAAPRVRAWIAVCRNGETLPAWASNYDAVVATIPSVRPTVAPWGRSDDDIMLLFTGGTTGTPKGVIWRQEDIIGRFGYGANPPLGLGSLSRPSAAGPRAAERRLELRLLAACPLMHGTGLMSSVAVLTYGGAVVLLPPGSFDAEKMWDEAERTRTTRIMIVGQAFAHPMLVALDANPGRWDLSSLNMIGSSGTIWSRENKEGLLRHLPQVMMSDSFSSSEAFAMATSITTKDGSTETASFELTPQCGVFTEAGTRVAPGSGDRGRIAISGHIPLGYYKDAEKTAASFPTYEGKRWSVPGDWATVSEDGGIVLLGRGSQCINTGGEKVFPEEVEEALKTFASVTDAGVTGVPDPRFGERIVALVEAHNPAPAIEVLKAHVRDRLAAYKTPREILFVSSIPRLANGKLDYREIKSVALQRLQEQGSNA